jgi:hypothetical protein
VLFADTHPDHTDRLRAILDLGAPSASPAVFTGAWPSGTTCRLAPDAPILTATGPAAHTAAATLLDLPLTYLDGPTLSAGGDTTGGADASATTPSGTRWPPGNSPRCRRNWRSRLSG